MNPKITPREAAASLSEIEAARNAMRSAIYQSRGHQHLWIWGSVWMAMSGAALLWGDNTCRHFPWIVAIGFLLSLAVGLTTKRVVRVPGGGRRIAALVAIWTFASLFPVVLRSPFEPRAFYAYCCLVGMLCYVVVGLWIDRLLVVIGILVSLLVLLGHFYFPSSFWIWMTGCGAALMATGFYVRSRWN